MDSDPSQIPVQPIPFDHALPNFARCLRSLGPAKVVALGSSTTAGEGGIVAYPYRLEALLRKQYADPDDRCPQSRHQWSGGAGRAGAAWARRHR